MIFPVIFFLLCARLTESSMFVGDQCTVGNDTPGVCSFVFNCRPVLNALLAGITPEKICGYHPDHVDPIICCPNQTASETTSPTNVNPRVQLQADGRGEIARRKCGEYAKFVFTKKFSPFGHRQEVNVSQCAIKAIPLITGGEKADRMEFPHMAAVGYNGPEGGIRWLCGGTLISETYVLSAAHCTWSSGLGQAEYIRVGDLNLASDDDGASPETRRIIERIRHPEYNPPAQYHDIALFRLESRVPFNGWIRPACLHTAPSTGTERAIATGWGKVEWMDAAGSDQLLKVTLSLVDSATCHSRWGNAPQDYKLPKGPNLDWAMCAGHQGNDTCQGDSGGPLVVFSDKRFHCMYDVVGITSLGKLCGINFPGIYTRVYHYVSWIESVVWPQG